jgi:hypothetical protein
LTPSPEGCHGRAADEELLRLYWPFTVSGVQNIFRIYQPLFTELLFSAPRYGRRKMARRWCKERGDGKELGTPGRDYHVFPSFSGYGLGRPPTQVVGVQPLAHYNFNRGYYLRSSGIWNIGYGYHNSVTPFGFGAGKVTKLRSGIVVNLYVEPQRSVHDAGTGPPTWQILTAATFQFSSRPKPNKPSSGKS